MDEDVCGATKKMIRQHFYTKFRWISALSLVLTSNLAFAEPAVNEDLLGLSVPALMGAFESINKVKKPQRSPRGERGLLRLPGTELAGINFETIFYFRDGVLTRIEQRRASSDSDCDAAFNAVLSTLNSRYGSAVRSDDIDGAGVQSQFSAWTAAQFQVVAYNLRHQAQCEVQVVFKQHQDIDASQL